MISANPARVPDRIQQPAPAHIHHRIRRKKRRLQPPKLRIGNVNRARDRADRHRQRLPVEVADRDRRRHQRHKVPRSGIPQQSSPRNALSNQRTPSQPRVTSLLSLCPDSIPARTRPRAPHATMNQASPHPGITCESGEIGRRTRLRIWRGNPWGFESPLSHHLSSRISVATEVPRLRSGFRQRAQTPAYRLKFEPPFRAKP